MIRAVLLDFGETLVERISDRAAPLTQLQPALFPETAEMLAELKRAGLLLAVVSNTESTTEPLMEAALTRLGIRERFDVVVTSLSAGSRKPDGGIYLRALVRLGCPPTEAVMVGDDLPVDIAGARALGMPAVLVRRDGSKPPLDDADVAVISSLTDLLPAVRQLAQRPRTS